jgi:hypothetical protein
MTALSDLGLALREKVEREFTAALLGTLARNLAVLVLEPDVGDAVSDSVASRG